MLCRQCQSSLVTPVQTVLQKSNAWLHGGKGDTRSLIREECCAEAALPTGKPEMPLPSQPSE